MEGTNVIARRANPDAATSKKERSHCEEGEARRGNLLTLLQSRRACFLATTGKTNVIARRAKPDEAIFLICQPSLSKQCNQPDLHADMAIHVLPPLFGRVRIAADAAATHGDRRDAFRNGQVGVGG